MPFFNRMRHPLRQLAILLALCASLSANSKVSTGIIYWTCGPADGPAFVIEVDGHGATPKTVIMVNEAMPDFMLRKSFAYKISNRMGHVTAAQCGELECGGSTSGRLLLKESDGGFVTGFYSLNTLGKIVTARFKVKRVERKMVCG